MEKNKDASSCILFMIARMQSKRSALALLHIWWCRKNIILEKKRIICMNLVAGSFFFLSFLNYVFKSPSWPLKYIVWWWDFSVVWKWTKSGYYQSFTIYISIIKKIGIFHFFVGFIIVLPSPWISRTSYLIIFCFG